MFDIFIKFLENLSEEQWKMMVDYNWTIKDVVAHLVNWEKECANQLPIVWKEQDAPWFLLNEDYAEFNRKGVDFYKNYTPNELLSEWKKWQAILDNEIAKIGGDKLKANTDLFGWALDDGHYMEHLNQIKKALRLQ